MIARPITMDEPDLLIGGEFMPLRIANLDGVDVVKLSPPEGGWTHDVLESIDYDAISPDGWDVHLGPQWIGSSEV